MIEFRSVYREPGATDVLFMLLAEREPHMNISHQKMPSYEQHRQFVRSIPYPTWMLMVNGDENVGTCYLTKSFEIGIFVFKKHRGCGYGRQALEWLKALHPEHKLLANINPRNLESIAFFEKHGAQHIQNTYEIRGGSPWQK